MKTMQEIDALIATLPKKLQWGNKRSRELGEQRDMSNFQLPTSQELEKIIDKWIEDENLRNNS